MSEHEGQRYRDTLDRVGQALEGPLTRADLKHRVQHDKAAELRVRLRFYILALTVASIGFSMLNADLTTALDWKTAMVFWSLSAIAGLWGLSRTVEEYEDKGDQELLKEIDNFTFPEKIALLLAQRDAGFAKEDIDKIVERSEPELGVIEAKIAKKRIFNKSLYLFQTVMFVGGACVFAKSSFLAG